MTRQQLHERHLRNLAAGKVEHPPELTDEDEAILDCVWASLGNPPATSAPATTPPAFSQPNRGTRTMTAITCTCGRGDALEGHPTTCPRGRAIRRRQKAGKL